MSQTAPSTTADPPDYYVTGYPDGAKTLLLDGPLAQRLAHIGMHQADLKFAKDCLDELTGFPQSSPTARSALWRIAVIYAIRCFDGGSVARGQLPREMFPAGQARDDFDYLMALRNKHIAHDENPLAQSIPGAVLLPEGAERKIAEIVAFQSTAATASTQNVARLRAVIATASVYAKDQFAMLVQKLAVELESKTYAELESMPDFVFSPARQDDVHRTRT